MKQRSLLVGLSFLVALPLSAQPDSAQLAIAKRAERAAALPLFTSHQPLELILTADFRTISRDRDTLSTTQHPGQLLLVGAQGDTTAFDVQLRTRGHYRLLQRNCPFVPLRVEFDREKVAKTVFEGQRALKLVTHCRDDSRYQDYIYHEALVYRIHNLVTPYSLRSRVVHVTYKLPEGRSLGRHPAFFIEHENDMARRNGGKIAEIRGALFDDLDPSETTRFALFEYMIGNTDWSIYALHNVRLVVADGQRYTPAAYDLDFSGLVGTHYATPDPKLSIRDVRTRLYRGPCSQVESIVPVAQQLLALRPAVLALYDSAPGLRRRTSDDAKYYLNEFFDTLSDPRRLKSNIIDRCNEKPGA